VEVFLGIVCKVFLSVVSKCSCSLHGAQQEQDKVVSSEVIPVRGQFWLYMANPGLQ
jgi:hypothetical protein